MKKLAAIVLALIMIMSFASCGKKEEPNPVAATPVGPGAENPLKEVESVDKLNEDLGLKLSTPGVMGVEEEVTQVIDCDDYEIGEYKFTVNGYECDFRGSAVYDKDISGLYLTDAGTVFEQSEISDVPTFVFVDGYKIARWATIDGQYVFNLADPNNEMSEETFMGIVDELISSTKPGESELDLLSFYIDLVGEYCDTVSQRATASVTANDDSVTIIISWSSSAMETTEWMMTAKKTEDGLLSYSDCWCSNYTYDADGKETEEVLYENESGFFAVEDGKLAWTGAVEDNCKQCVFEKIQY